MDASIVYKFEKNEVFVTYLCCWIFVLSFLSFANLFRYFFFFLKNFIVLFIF